MFEIRSYHYDPEKFEAYKAWVIADVLPYLKANLNLVGFWIEGDKAPEIAGSDPQENKHGVANVTWIINWGSEAARKRGFKEVLAGETWDAIWAKHPDPDGYLQMESRFAEEL